MQDCVGLNLASGAFYPLPLRWDHPPITEKESFRVQEIWIPYSPIGPFFLTWNLDGPGLRVSPKMFEEWELARHRAGLTSLQIIGVT